MIKDGGEFIPGPRQFNSFEGLWSRVARADRDETCVLSLLNYKLRKEAP